MLKAKKKNRVVRIPDEKATEYRALGYTITTMDGTIVSEPDDDKHRIQKLESENADLKAQLAAMAATQDKSAVPEQKTEAKTRKTAKKSE